MTTIIEVTNGRGTTRRCDAACHQAKGKECNCVCAGRFHGRADAAEADWQEIAEVREQLDLEGHESVQLRFGA